MSSEPPAFTPDNLCSSSSTFISSGNVQEDYAALCSALSGDNSHRNGSTSIHSPSSSSSSSSSTSGTPERTTHVPSINCDAESVASNQSSGADALHRIYRNKVAKFYRNKENYRRLEAFITHRDTDVCSVFLHFIVRYCETKFIHTVRASDRDTKPQKQSVYCPKDEYTRALRKYQKCYYNFEAKAGEGDIFWKGVRNPRFHVSPENGPISLPIAKLIALYWAIDFGFDTVFWTKYNDVKEQYRQFVRKTKLRYTETHKNKKKRIRKEEEELVIKERKEKEEEEKRKRIEAGLPPKKRTRRRKKDGPVSTRQPTRLSRKERRVVVQRIKARNLKSAAERKEERAKNKKRKACQSKGKKSVRIDVSEVEI